jgi:hypothetical protein
MAVTDSEVRRDRSCNPARSLGIYISGGVICAKFTVSCIRRLIRLETDRYSRIRAFQDAVYTRTDPYLVAPLTRVQPKTIDESLANTASTAHVYNLRPPTHHWRP